MIEFDASFGLHAIVSAAIIDEFMIDEKRLFDYTQMSMRADGLYYTVFLCVLTIGWARPDNNYRLTLT